MRFIKASTLLNLFGLQDDEEDRSFMHHLCGRDSWGLFAVVNWLTVLCCQIGKLRFNYRRLIKLSIYQQLLAICLSPLLGFIPFCNSGICTIIYSVLFIICTVYRVYVLLLFMVFINKNIFFQKNKNKSY